MEEELFKTVPNILSTCNCLHILLLVYLRVIAITRPLMYRDIHRRHHFKTPIIIWILSITVNLFPPLALCFWSRTLHLIFILFILHVFHTIPIGCIVVMYVKMIQVIRERNKRNMRGSDITDETERKRLNTKLSTSMIKGVAVCLVICYLPYLFWWQYARIRNWHDESDKKLNVSKSEVTK